MKISVIIPVYNVEKYLDTCLKSVVGQTFRDFEVVAVNDGSKDNSLKILQEWAAKDSRIRVIDQENKGVSAARNTGLDVAQGEYVCFIDSDDYIHPQMFELLLEIAEKEKVDVVFSQACSSKVDVVYNFPKYTKDEKYVAFENPFVYAGKNQTKTMSSSVCAKLYRREILKDIYFDTELSYAEDFLFNIRVFSRLQKGALLPLAFYCYVNVENSLMRKSMRFDRFEAHDLTYRKLKAYFQNNPEKWKVVKTYYINRNCYYAVVKTILDISDDDKRQEFIRKMIPMLRSLFKDGVIGMEGFSWHRKFKLYWLLCFGRSLI